MPPRKRLNPKQRLFVKAYCSPKSPTAFDATASYQKVYGVDYKSANSSSSVMLDRPIVQKAMKEMLAETDIADLVREGLYKVVKGFVKSDAYKPKDFTAVAQLITEIRGDKAPEKQIVVTLTSEERDQEYEKIVQLVRKTERDVLQPAPVEEEMVSPSPASGDKPK